ncbi:MAG: hypothetical protein Q4615_14165 [Paracoccus aminovorans]|nr:hypothetical protein [Paracoccus aminovorans]
MDLPGDRPVPPEIDGEFTEIPLISDTGPDGSRAGAVAAPGGGVPSLSAPPGAAATNPVPLAPPAGPVERLAQGIVAATPQALPAPPARFPDQKPGGAIRFGDPASGQIIDGVFLGETEAGARVRVQGREIDLTPEQFDAGRDAVARIEEERKRAEQEAKQAAKALPAPQQEAPADVDPSDAGEARYTALPAATAASGPDDGLPGSGAPIAAGRAADQEGREAVPPMAAGGVPAGQGGMSSGLDRLGDLDLADDTGELRGSLSPEGVVTAPP